MLSPVDRVVRRAVMVPPRPTPVLVGIDGRAGAGKTTLAGLVAKRLHAQVVHLDELYDGWSGGAAGNRLLVKRVLRPLARGEHAAYPVFDWETGEYASRRRVEPAVYVVVEGVFSTIRAARDLLDVRVWLEVPAPLRRERALARDGDGFAPHWDAWARQEDELFGPDRPWEHAHEVIEG
ncbi:dephospho-CoA kinase [Calidifontibacter sp. DB0510]|uniref:Dephospho-CoA kinase n=1 Tax=Metallococcus carri TaxID=1656884 RepID=A0A967B059_9MICO|nr:dephospho-CoA kinase [Metallococcus carri]NHN54988.1 dephospho-CoA kinase [Metallococcus carri]NOP37334.1 dephospho-CoA kinase [Calidifontibacter sp. DB2511S]